MNNSGITNFNVLNTNALYIQGIQVDFGATNAYLQGEIDAIQQQLIPIEAITSRIDFTQQPLLIGDLVITEANKNSVLLTAIQALQQSIGSITKLDLTALPAVPPGACVITPTTTNQALKALIDTNTGNISTIQGQITSINTTIAGINAKLAHYSTFTYGSDTMSGIADGTGFAVAVSGGSQSGNGIFVYPNASAQTEQIQLISANDKNILLRGGDQVGIFGAQTASMTNRTLIDIGDKTDIIHIGRNHNVGEYPEIDIGVDYNITSLANASTTNIEGDVYFSNFGSSIYDVAPYTPLLCADTLNPLKLGNTNNYTTDPTLSGLDVTGNGVAPITLTAVTGAIPISAALGLISLTALAGGITLATGAGIMTLNCGAGGFFLNSGVGVMNFASGSGNINTTTISGNITMGAGKATGGTAGNVVLNALQKAIIQPDTQTEIYKTAFIEMNTNATTPAVTTRRIYDVAGALYYNGSALGGGGGSAYVLKAGDTMTGALTLPEGITSILTLNNLTSPPSPVTNRLYLLNNVLTFNGTAIGGGGGAFVPLAGGTMTGALNINYDGGQTTPQFAVINTNNSTPIGSQGATIAVRNDSAGNGASGDRCGQLVFQAKDSVGTGARNFASIQAFVNDPTSTSIDGRLSTFVASSNTSTEMLRLVSTTTGVRQVNIAATNTIIGPSSLGASTTDALRVQGSQSITTTLDVPLIQNAPAIYPATSSTLVDGAVRQYHPERVYKLDDYPSPLSAPTMDGEKVFILNKTGNPAGLDQIWAAADFPTISGTTITQVIQAKYVDKTSQTPAANYISTLYSNNVCRVFVQADVDGTALTMVQVCNSTNTNGTTGILDMVITCYGAAHRLYYGGAFTTTTLELAGSSVVSTNNFSGQIVNTWSSTGINTQTHTAMPSYATTQDGQGAIWGGIQGLNNMVNCLVDMTGNSSGFSQPTPPSGQKYDSIVIGGNFTGINDPTPSRLLNHIAYYDWTPTSNPTTTQVYNVTSGNQTGFPGSAQLYGSIGYLDPQYSWTSTGSVRLRVDRTSDPSATASCYMNIITQGGGSIVVTSSSIYINSDIFVDYQFTLPSFTPSQFTTYQLQLNNLNLSNPSCPAYFEQSDSGFGVAELTATNNISPSNPIGWRTFANDNWSTPVGPTSQVKGAAAFSSGYIGFAYTGQTIIAAPQSAITSNYYFSMYYSNGSATFQNLGSDDMVIETGAVIIGEVNCVTGGNPTLAYGPGNAIAYGEIYLNRFTTNGTTFGLNFRYTSNDPYNLSTNLIITENGLAASQLLPSSGEKSVSCFRNDAIFPNTYFLSMNTETKTATLPWSQGQAPNYTSLSLTAYPSPPTPLPSIGFGGYSDEIGYQGLVIYGGSPTNGYLYKAANAGELVIDLSGCVVRTSGDNGSPVVALDKLTFPAGQDGNSIMLLGDTTTDNPYNKPSWWAVSQDGILVYDNTTINSRGGGSSGITSVTTTGSGLSSSTISGAVTLENTGVTSIVAGTNITISGATGAVTINATGGGGVTSLSPYTLPSGNQTPFLIYPGYLTSGALQGYISPTKLSFYDAYVSNITISNGNSIFSGGQSVPGGTIGQSISPQFTNTSKKYKLTCSVSIKDNIGGSNFNGGNHYGNFAITFSNTSIPSTSYGSIWGGSGAGNSGAPIPTQSTGDVFGTSWTDVFVNDVNSPGRYIDLGSTWDIFYIGNYSASSLSAYVYWELEYMVDP